MVKGLDTHPHAQCFVVISDGYTMFFSYTTPFAVIDSWGYVHPLHCLDHSSYSNCRQLSWFLKEYTKIDYQYFKKCAAKGLAVHKDSGKCFPN